MKRLECVSIGSESVWAVAVRLRGNLLLHRHLRRPARLHRDHRRREFCLPLSQHSAWFDDASMCFCDDGTHVHEECLVVKWVRC